MQAVLVCPLVLVCRCLWAWMSNIPQSQYGWVGLLKNCTFSEHWVSEPAQYFHVLPIPHCRHARMHTYICLCKLGGPPHLIFPAPSMGVQARSRIVCLSIMIAESVSLLISLISAHSLTMGLPECPPICTSTRLMCPQVHDHPCLHVPVGHHM